MTSTTLHRITSLAALVFALALAAVHLGFFIHLQGVARTTRARCQTQADQASGTILKAMQGAEGAAHGLVRDLESGRLSSAQVQGALTRALEQEGGTALRLAVLFRPGAVAPGPFGPAAERVGKEVRPYRYESSSDYTAQAWFRTEPWKAGWDEPGLSERGGVLRVVYMEPFRLPGAAAPSGLVRLTVALTGIQALVDGLDVGRIGYGFLLSAKGVYLADPRMELVTGRKTIQYMADATRDPGRRYLAQLVARGTGGFTEGFSGVTGQRTWIFLSRLPSLGWSLGLMYTKDDLSLRPPWERWVRALEVSLALGLALTLIFLGFRGHHGAQRDLWWAVAAGSLAIAAACAALFYLINSLPPPPTPSDEFQVMDRTSLDRFMERYRTRKAGDAQVTTTFRPTGVFLQTLEAAGPGLMKMTGIVWQRFPGGTPRDQRGVVFPEATTGEASLGIEQPEGNDVIQYYPFHVVVREEINSADRYPFDRTRVRLRIWPKQFMKPELPIPDLDTYVVPSPKALPGVDEETGLPGWTVEATDFSYDLEKYNTRFGLGSFPGTRDTPELVYNVTLKRRFLGPFIVAFLPILAVAVLLFTLVLTVSQMSDKVKATGYGYLNFLRTTIALFFSLMVAQYNIRARVVAEGVIDLEWYFFILYGAILGVSVNALVFAVSENSLVRYDDNALAKLAFWPLLLFGFYLNTLVYLR